MSYDYVAWKRSPTTKTAMLAAVFDATGEGKDHPAMAPFDAAEAERELIKIFGDVNDDPDGPFLYCIEYGETCPWMTFNVNHSEVQAITPKLVRWALDRGLMIYDPQRGAVWGNKRS